MMVFPQLKNYHDVYFSIELTYARLLYFFPCRRLSGVHMAECLLVSDCSHEYSLCPCSFKDCKTKGLLSETA